MNRAKIWVARMGAWETRSRFFSGILGFFLHGYLVVAGVVGFFALIAAIPGAQISAFSIGGNSVVEEGAIVGILEKTLTQPFAFFVGRDVPLWVPKEEIAAAVYALDPHIRDVVVSGRFSRTLTITVTEEAPAMLWCGSDVPSGGGEDSPCWFANDRGTIYASAPEYTEAPFLKFYTTPAPIFFDPYPRAHEYPLGYTIADDITMERLQALADALPERGYRVMTLGITRDADVIVSTEEGVRFLFSLSRDIIEDMERFEALREALQKKGDTTPLSEVDLRFDTKVYYQ